ncbi:MAG: phosphoribosyl-ATP diphosphatase [Alphaproteobacteria bacterium]|nr:phosphoribosyl-ATP diphosphatase [Alphaproteobacteria bacterium]
MAKATKPGEAKRAKAKPAEKLMKKLSVIEKIAKKKAALPLPGGLKAKRAKLPKRIRKVEARVLEPLSISSAGVDAMILDRLWETVEQRRLAGDVTTSHSARLMARGTAKVAQKFGEEAVECVIEATIGNRAATVLESADVLYHLMVIWVDAGIRPDEVWAELARRQGISGIAEKAARPQGIIRAAGTTKLP